MGTWDATEPSDDNLANTIHTGIQTTKVDVMERLRSYNGINYEHLVFNGSATGRHLISAVGFSEIFTDLFDAQAWIDTNFPGNGGIFVAGQSLYIVDSLAPTKVTTIDHGELSNLTGDDHTQYVDVSGVRAATGNWSLTGSAQLTATTFGTGSSDAMGTSHVGGSLGSGWYAAHGANCLWQRHFADGSVYLTVIDYSESLTNYPGVPVRIVSFNATTDKYSSFPVNACTASSFHNPISCGYYGGNPVYTYTQAGNIYIRYSTIRNGASI